MSTFPRFRIASVFITLNYHQYFKDGQSASRLRQPLLYLKKIALTAENQYI